MVPAMGRALTPPTAILWTIRTVSDLPLVPYASDGG